MRTMPSACLSGLLPGLLSDMDFHIPRLYAILDAAQAPTHSLIDLAEILLESGVRLIQYRDKQANARRLFTMSQEIGERVREAGGIFIGTTPLVIGGAEAQTVRTWDRMICLWKWPGVYSLPIS